MHHIKTTRTDGKTTTKQGTPILCAYFMGYTVVCLWVREHPINRSPDSSATGQSNHDSLILDLIMTVIICKHPPPPPPPPPPPKKKKKKKKERKTKDHTKPTTSQGSSCVSLVSSKSNLWSDFIIILFYAMSHYTEPSYIHVKLQKEIRNISCEKQHILYLWNTIVQHQRRFMHHDYSYWVNHPIIRNPILW